MNYNQVTYQRQISILGLCFFIFLIMHLLAGCKKDDDQQNSDLTPYTINIPAGFPKMEIPENNRPYAERIALGRKLYYDPIMSNDGRSCSSCHIQQDGFGNSSKAGMPVLPHINMAWKDIYMWDGSKQGKLEEVMLFEVEQFFGTDISKLNQHPMYPGLFKEAYGVEEISSNDVARALAQFFRVLISADSKYDRMQAMQAQFNNDELQGYIIFNSEKGSCYHCHTPPLFSDNHLHNNGLDSIYDNPANHGYFSVSGDSTHLGHMRTPTLRNVSLRKHYMHDGRFSTLEEVVNHYNEGVKLSPSLDPVMQKGDYNLKLNLSPAEVSQLVAFLKTLTDSTFISDPSLCKPH